MEREIYFIGDETSFILKSIQEGLANNNFDCRNIPFDISEMAEMTSSGSFLFLNVDDIALNKRSVISHIKNLWNGDNGQLLIMGYKADVGSIINLFPTDMIGQIFYRPINAKDVVEHIISMAKKEDKASKKKHILLVDDSGVELRAIKKILEHEYRISMVNSAASAISFLAVNEPDLILLDYDMPVCSGPQLLQMIRSESKMEKIPVMFLTGKSDKESVQSVLELKPQGYMLKTQTGEQILKTVGDFFTK